MHTGWGRAAAAPATPILLDGRWSPQPHHSPSSHASYQLASSSPSSTTFDLGQMLFLQLKTGKGVSESSSDLLRVAKLMSSIAHIVKETPDSKRSTLRIHTHSQARGEVGFWVPVRQPHQNFLNHKLLYRLKCAQARHLHLHKSWPGSEGLLISYQKQNIRMQAQETDHLRRITSICCC